jgi:hypothetical protein
LLFDQLETFRNVTKRNVKIADVSDLQARTRIDPSLRMCSIDEHAARAPNSVRAETRAAAIRRADIERSAGDAKLRIMIRVPEAEEMRRH